MSPASHTTPSTGDAGAALTLDERNDLRRHQAATGFNKSISERVGHLRRTKAPAFKR